MSDGPLLGGSYIIDWYVDLYSLTFSEQGEPYRLTHADLFELIGQIGHRPHTLTIRADDNIAESSSTGIDTTEARACSRRSRDGAHNHNPFNAYSGGHRFGKYPPAEPGALEMGPLEAAVGVADAAPVVGAA